MSNKLLAQVGTSIGNIGEGGGFGPFSSDQLGANPIEAVVKIISTIIGFITLIAGIYFMFQFFIGAFGWLTSSGDKQRLTDAQNRLSHSLIGLIIVVATYAIMSIIQVVTGLNFLNPASLIDALVL